MALLQPYMLWGIIGVALPVAIHFWYQKKGKTIAWAASRWLTEQTTLQHRGIRLHEVWLMILRCLLVIVLALILSKPVWNWLNSNGNAGNIHLVEPDRQVVDSYRFELEKAIKQGEAMYWMGPTPEKMSDIAILPSTGNHLLFLQQAINQLAAKGGKFNIYLREEADLGKIYVPGDYRIFPIKGSPSSVEIPFIDLGAGKRLFIDPKTGQLTVTEKENEHAFMPEPLHSGQFPVLVDYRNAEEQRTVQAALAALQEVYEIPFSIDLKSDPKKHYEWILTDRQTADYKPDVLYVVSGAASATNAMANVIPVSDSLRMATSTIVEDGRLPEWLGEVMVGYFGLKAKSTPFSGRQLNEMFEKVKPVNDQTTARTQQWLLVIFMVLMILERWMALRKTAGSNHG